MLSRFLFNDNFLSTCIFLVTSSKLPLFYFISQDFAVKYWVSLGTPKEKLNLGIASYGRTFTLKYLDDNDLFAPTTGPGKNTTYVREPGATSYYEVNLLILLY
jgi:GH18 family chitinase